MHLDLLVRGGTLVDGTGGPPRRGDVGVRGGVIAMVGEPCGAVTATREIDAAGSIVCPGFIDIHTHSDLTLLRDPRGQSKIHQGITTEVTGNCGFSPFPIARGRLREHRDLLAMLGDVGPALEWTDCGGYVAALEARRPIMNIAPLVGHGAIRVAIMGLDQRAPTSDELQAMGRLLEQSLEAGAWGLSTGLTYVPSGFADEAEIEFLASITARHDRLYATHARVTAGRAFQAILEAASVGRATGVRVQYSHLALNEPSSWHRAREVLATLERVRDDGIDIAYDVYPYDASSSSLAQYLPQWLQAGGPAAMARRLRSPETWRRAEKELAAGWAGGIPWYWDRVILSTVGPDDDSGVGRSIADLAHEAGMSPPEYVLGLCARYGNSVRVVLFYRKEADVVEFLRHPLAVIGSDGSAVAGAQQASRPHPRSFGCHPRVLGEYVRVRRILSVTEAVHKMTGAVADRLGIRTRGRLRPGLAADITVFDPSIVAERSSYRRPCELPVGISHVLVNGEVVLEKGRQTGRRGGRVLTA